MRLRPALYRNRSPLMRREGAAVRLVSCCTNPRQSKYIQAYMWKSSVLRRPVPLQGCSEQLSLKWLGQGILEISQRLDRLGAGCNQPERPFFSPLGERVLCFAQNGGRTGRGVLIPGYFEPCNFPSQSLAAVQGLLIAAASPLQSTGSVQGMRASVVVAPGLQSAGLTVVLHRLTCSKACGISLEQGWKPRLLRWQVDSSPLSHQGSHYCFYFISFATRHVRS